MKKKVSFDYDATLSRKDVQEFAKELVEQGFDVWIVTSRTSTEDIVARNWTWCLNQNEIVFEVAEECGIPKENIVFTDHTDKVNFLKGKDFLLHLDDDVDELMEILRSGDKCNPLNVNSLSWKENCIETLNKKL
jgi:hypothetical protein